MRISLKLSDFINSKYHKETTDFFSGVLLSNLRPEFFDYEYVLETPTPFNYRMGAGRKEVLAFVRDGLGITEDVIIDFEDFSVHIPLQPEIDEGAQNPGIIAFISVRRVWLPRKKKIELRYYEELRCYDGKLYCVYVIEKAVLPKNRRDLYKLLKWLRLKKRLLFPPDHARWCRDFWHSADKLTILTNDRGIIEGFESRCFIMGISEGLIGEFLDWQHNRYKITK